MRTVLFVALGALAAFVAGLAGTYFVMPKVAPDLVEAQRMQVDSLATDSLRSDSLVATSLAMADSLFSADSLVLPPADAALSDTPGALRDSLAALQRRLADYEKQIGAFEAKISTAEAQRAQASDLASTLIKLEDRELSRVLDQLDFDVLELLYAEASARNRARLLGALAPARTAVFIQRATSSRPPAELVPEAEPVEPDADASIPG